MQRSDLLKSLGYADSPNFLAGEELSRVPGYAHILRTARAKCGLRGTYTLQHREHGTIQSLVPVVYVCEAEGDEEADRIHRLVWNQSVVPFILVLTPSKIRLYSGFKYASSKRTRNPGAQGILNAAIDFNEVASVLGAFKAESIDDGSLWREWGSHVTPHTRVDWELLSNLEALDKYLQNDDLSRPDSHALIGKYVYLQYLRAREILSDRKLKEWGIDPNHVFGRGATLKAFQSLLKELENWLNGAVFPLSSSSIRTIGQKRLRLVAGTFAGDSPGGQLHLDFEAYDFSFIPIETLSVIYEQFLHAPDPKSGESQGKKRGAYYTPVPLVNFMLDEMERHRPLLPGMRVLDPTCGSGAFLVQCYRKLIEQRIQADPNVKPRPTELRDILTKHIFGVDSDPDACQVAELSLILTLLDYVNPPDLSTTNFKLPELQDRNIWCCDAFDDESPWLSSNRAQRFDWVVGNPPWKDLKSKNLEPQDKLAFAWMQQNKKRYPTGGNQIAEAFAWRVTEWIADGGLVGLLLPAMTLFKYESRKFREEFFNRTTLRSVANFANLAEVLFSGRSRVPAAAFFFSPRGNDESECASPDSVLVYSPLVANQEANRPSGSSKRQDTWSIVVNASEMREIPYRDIQNGDGLPWKLVTWGSMWDLRLLKSIQHKGFQTLGDLKADRQLLISEGLKLRNKPKSPSEANNVEHHPELAGKDRLKTAALRKRKHLFRFPGSVIERMHKDDCYVEKGRFDKRFPVCKPPHVILNEARTFAVYSKTFLVVKDRYIGIAGDAAQKDFLIALALYLNSDFVRYHQFLNSTKFGVQRAAATLRALKPLPIPFWGAERRELRVWCQLHERLVSTSEAQVDGAENASLYVHSPAQNTVASLLDELNQLVNDSLGLNKRERALVHDLVHVRMALNDGKVGKPAVDQPSKPEMRAYGVTLQRELDSFLGDEVPEKHLITVVYDDHSGMIAVDLLPEASGSQKVDVLNADSQTANEFRRVREHVREEGSQWVYFDRNLRIYEGSRTYLFKPMQRVHWTRSQAFIDAGEIIAETLAPTEI